MVLLGQKAPLASPPALLQPSQVYFTLQSHRSYVLEDFIMEITFFSACILS